MKDYKLFIVNKDYFWNPDIAKDNDNNLVTGIGVESIPIQITGAIDIIAIIENGLMHNINGPASINSDGSLGYWLNGKRVGRNLSNKEFQQKIKETIFE